MRRRVTWKRALRASFTACLLVAAVLFVAANFVLVEVHLPGLTLELRLGWAVVVPAALAFAAGVLHAHGGREARDAQRSSPQRSTDDRCRAGRPA